MSDLHMSILDSIFGKESITEEYIPFCDILLLAFKAENKEDESILYEKAGFEIMKTPKKTWGQQLIRISYGIDRRNKRKGRFQ
jgi:hypothetical protein